MSIIYNGSSLTDTKYNGIVLDKVYYGTTEVYSKSKKADFYIALIASNTAYYFHGFSQQSVTFTDTIELRYSKSNDNFTITTTPRPYRANINTVFSDDTAMPQVTTSYFNLGSSENLGSNKEPFTCGVYATYTAKAGSTTDSILCYVVYKFDGSTITSKTFYNVNNKRINIYDNSGTYSTNSLTASYTGLLNWG